MSKAKYLVSDGEWFTGKVVTINKEWVTFSIGDYKTAYPDFTEKRLKVLVHVPTGMPIGFVENSKQAREIIKMISSIEYIRTYTRVYYGKSGVCDERTSDNFGSGLSSEESIAREVHEFFITCGDYQYTSRAHKLYKVEEIT